MPSEVLHDFYKKKIMNSTVPMHSILFPRTKSITLIHILKVNTVILYDHIMPVLERFKYRVLKYEQKILP